LKEKDWKMQIQKNLEILWKYADSCLKNSRSDEKIEYYEEMSKNMH
jgi:hypothetical protein